MSSKRNNDSEEDDFEKDFRSSSSKGSNNKKAKKSDSPKETRKTRERQKTAVIDETYKNDLEKAIALSLSESSISGKEQSSVDSCKNEKKLNQDKLNINETEIKSNSSKKQTPLKKSKFKMDKEDDVDDDFIVRPKNKESSSNLKEQSGNKKDNDLPKKEEITEKNIETTKNQSNEDMKSIKDQDEDYSDDDSQVLEESELSEDDDDFKVKNKKSTSKKKFENNKKSKNNDQSAIIGKKKSPTNKKSSSKTLTDDIDPKLTSISNISMNKNDHETKIMEQCESNSQEKQITTKTVLKSAENLNSPKEIKSTINTNPIVNKPFTSLIPSALSTAPLGKIEIKTPVQVRVGLSRNSKVKPLHPNVKPI